MHWALPSEPARRQRDREHTGQHGLGGSTEAMDTQTAPSGTARVQANATVSVTFLVPSNVIGDSKDLAEHKPLAVFPVRNPRRGDEFRRTLDVWFGLQRGSQGGGFKHFRSPFLMTITLFTDSGSSLTRRASCVCFCNVPWSLLLFVCSWDSQSCPPLPEDQSSTDLKDKHRYVTTCVQTETNETRAGVSQATQFLREVRSSRMSFLGDMGPGQRLRCQRCGFWVTSCGHKTQCERTVCGFVHSEAPTAKPQSRRQIVILTCSVCVSEILVPKRNQTTNQSVNPANSQSVNSLIWVQKGFYHGSSHGAVSGRRSTSGRASWGKAGSIIKTEI